MPETDLDILRKGLSACDYDPSRFIESQIADVMDSLNEGLESKLLLIFDGLTRELAEHSEKLESEVTSLRASAQETNTTMLEDMDHHALRLNDVREAVDDVKAAFERASEGAVKIGDRLSVSEAERKRLEMSMNLISFINWYDNKPVDFFEDVIKKDLDTLRETFAPEALHDKSWGHITQILSYLRRVLFDLSSDFAQTGLKNILRVSEAVEQALLHDFFEYLSQLMRCKGHGGNEKEAKEITDKCREIVSWLHTFNTGQTLHKRFIYAIIEKRMPKVIDFEDGHAVLPGSRPGTSKTTGFEYAEDADPDDFVDCMDCVDYLSELFGTIGKVCQEQFTIIRDIFPAYAVPKMTRILIQRIYNDPAFGIQGRVDSILNPKPPSPPLPLGDYLESLLTVREKLTALHLILLDLCSHPAMHGMGRENAKDIPTTAPDGDGGGFMFASEKHEVVAELNETQVEEDIAIKEKSLIEVQEFLDEQTFQVLSSYMGSYFDKELAFLRSSYISSLRKLFHSGSADALVIAPAGQTPRLNAKRVRSITDFVTTVANGKYLGIVMGITNDSITRVQNIARDSNRLSSMIRDLFIQQLEFFIDNVMLPTMQECTSTLTSRATKGQSTSVLPPTDYLQLLAFSTEASGVFKKELEQRFIEYLSDQSNMIVVYKEALRNSLQALDFLNKQSMDAWRTCVLNHIERLLTSMQSKGDYGKAFLQTSRSHNTTSAACNAVCKELRIVADAVRQNAERLKRWDIMETFYNPLGNQFTCLLVTHIRKSKITEEGSQTLLKDLHEYAAVMELFESKDNIDLLHCIQEIAQVYKVSGDKVKKVVTEDLRHLDTDVVLALTRARSDFGTIQKSSDHWTKTIAATYSFTKWEQEPSWEKRANRKGGSVASGFPTMQSGANKGPALVSIRKSGAPVSSLYLEIQARNGRAKNTASEVEEVKKQSNTNDNSQNDQLSDITGASSFAAAMQSRFSHFMQPGANFVAPARPIDDTTGDSGGSSKLTTVSEFRPLTFLSNAIGSHSSRPDLVGENRKGVDRQSESLLNRAKQNLGFAIHSSGSTSKAAADSASSTSTSTTSSSTKSATPMRDTMKSMMSNMSSWGSSPKTESPTPTKQKQTNSSSMFGSFRWGGSS